MTQHCYQPTLRPASFSTVPSGWEYVEAPWDLTTRPDLKRSEYRFGVIAYPARLSREDEERFSLNYLGDRTPRPAAREY